MEDIKNLRDLAKIIDLLNKKRVKRFKLNGLELELSNDPPVSSYKRKQKTTQSEIATPGQLTDEEILFWSSDPLSMEGIN